MATKYLVLIAAGNDDYRPKVGWDDRHDTYAAAEQLAAQARRQDGWAAKVVPIECSATSAQQSRRRSREMAQFGRILE